MSTKVIKDISCDYAAFSGNVSFVRPDFVSVPDLSDIRSINEKILKLERIIDNLQKENKQMHALLKECVKDLETTNQANIAKIADILKRHQAATIAFIENSQK